MRVGSFMALALVAAIVAHAQGSIPHIDDCDFCFKCHVDSMDPGPSAARQLTATEALDHGGLQSSSSSSRQHSTSARTQLDVLAEHRSYAIGAIDSHRPAAEAVAAAGRRALPATSNTRQILDGAVDPFEDPNQPPAMRASAYRIQHGDKVPKSSLPNCTECRGCNTELQTMAAQTKFFDRTFTNEKGATSGWLFQATTNRTADGKAVVKIYCMPLPKRPGAQVPVCAPEFILKNMRLLNAIEKISQECGFEDIIPKVWMDKVTAPVPEIGFHVRWHALWMEVAQGVSLENFLHQGEPSRFPPSVILDLMHNKLDRMQVIKAAIFDLLTSQCDRHAQNIFINEAGQLKLIDNEAALQSSWKNCGFNSILVPTTQKQEIVRLSNEFVNKLVTAENAPQGHADPQLLLDYRCYLPEGREEMGTDYPPQVQQCLRAIASKSVQEVKEHYGFLEDLPAHNLRARATDMITRGYEYACKYGEPLNVNSRRYRIQPKCCRIKYEDRRYQCAHPWAPKFEIPVGDPITGRPWSEATKGRPDTGTYEGGTFPQD